MVRELILDCLGRKELILDRPVHNELILGQPVHKELILDRPVHKELILDHSMEQTHHHSIKLLLDSMGTFSVFFVGQGGGAL